MGFISFTFNKAYFYFIIYWIINVINSIEVSFFEKYSQYSDEYQTDFNLLYLVCVNLGEMLAGILVLITKIKMMYLKRKYVQNSIKKFSKKAYKDLSLKNSKNKYILLILMSILDFLGRGIDFLYLLIFNTINLEPRHISWLISVDILSRIYFCRSVLKLKIHKHHKYSLILCSIGFFIMTIFSLQSIFFDKKGEYNTFKNWVYIMFIIAQKIFFSSGDIMSKILLTDKFFLVHYLMFYKSFICFLFFIILIPILFSTSNLRYSNFEKLFQTGDIHTHILLKIFLIILAFFGCFSIFKIIDIFTPIHVGFINVVFALLEVIRFAVSSDGKEHLIYIIAYIICLLVIGFGTLIFTEIIIINVCGLNEYTHEGFLIKEQLDQFPPESTVLFDESNYIILNNL
jgi:hypothetical protein